MTLGALAVRHQAASAALVRHCIADDLAGRAVSQDSIEDVVLVVSELVGNAVVHTPEVAAEDLDVRWQVEPDAVLVQVADPSPEPPRPRATGAGDTGGRGLAIVAALAADWGTRPLGAGKQVWARVPISAR